MTSDILYVYTYDHDFHQARKDNENLNCSIPDITEFPNLFRKKGIFNTVICILLSAYLFILLAILCDKYLVPAMERLCYSLHLSSDVAGATFLASATSAPELFVAFVGTFVTEGDIGIGTIVGSSIFNLLAIAAVCGIATGVTAKLDWWPLTRDCAWYMLSIIMLGVVMFSDSITYEPPVFLLVYSIYLLSLAYDRTIQSFFRTVDLERDMINEDPLEREGDERLNSFKENICTKPEKDTNLMWKIWWAIQYPGMVFLALTTPSPRAPYFLTIIVSVIWISLISYGCVWFITAVGYNFGIPDGIMGLTVLAAGTSVPELISSYIVCKKVLLYLSIITLGMASMAICNAVGSNTFDILICLGLPWTIKGVFLGEKISFDSTTMYLTIGMITVWSVVFYICFLITKFVLGSCVGWMSLSMYTMFLIVSSYIEMKNIKTQCDIESAEYAYLNK